MMKLLAVLCLIFVSCAEAAEYIVSSPEELRKTLPELTDGDTLSIAPGDYPGGNRISGVRNLTITAAVPERPPHFKGGTEAWHFSRTPGLTLRFLDLSGQTGNGINIDDGGKMNQPVESILLEHIRVEDIGPKGNFDGIKCSGLKKLTIRDCSVSGWGGQAIDLVGCRQVLITGCKITGKAKGFTQTTGPQFKGGCEDVILEKCHLINAGARPVQLGGSTGNAYFRPPGAKYEARRITVRDNLIEGGECAAAFTGVNGGKFINNTIRFPDKWVFRILWEKRDEGFVPTSDMVIADNDILFRRSAVTHAFNIGTGTNVESFTFARNRWLAEDQPAKSKPGLPVEETGGKYGKH